LAEDSDLDVRRAAAISLAHAGAPALGPLLLATRDVWARSESIKSIAHILEAGTPDDDVLLELLNSTENLVIAPAADALRRRLGPKRAVPRLLRLLDSGLSQVGVAAAQALIALDAETPQAVGLVVRAHEGSSGIIRDDLRRTIRASETAVELLRDVAMGEVKDGQHPQGVRRTAAIGALAWVRDQEAASRIYDALLAEGGWAALYAARSLREAGAPVARLTPVLQKALTAEDWSLRIAAARTLTRVDPESTEQLPVLVSALRIPAVRYEAVRLLGEMGPRASSVARDVADALNSWDERMQPGMAMALAAMGVDREEVATALWKGLASPSQLTRRASALALIRLGGPDESQMRTLLNTIAQATYPGDRRGLGVGPFLREVFAALAQDGSSQACAARTLSAMGRSGSFPVFASEALALLAPSDPATHEALIRVLALGDADARAEAAFWIRTIGMMDRRAVPLLAGEIFREPARGRGHETWPVSTLAPMITDAEREQLCGMLESVLVGPCDETYALRALSAMGTKARAAVPRLRELTRDASVAAPLRVKIAATIRAIEGE
jgi:HEAT repeat protein